jgi:hypothetical protein
MESVLYAIINILLRYDIAYNFTHSNTTPSSSSFEGRINLLPGASYLLILYPSDDRQLIAVRGTLINKLIDFAVNLRNNFYSSRRN